MAASVYGKNSAEFDRGVGFFDAIYGFAITLLITSVHLPPTAAWRRRHALLSSALPSELYGFLLSFVVIAVFWRENYLVLSFLTPTPPASAEATAQPPVYDTPLGTIGPRAFQPEIYVVSRFGAERRSSVSGSGEL